MRDTENSGRPIWQDLASAFSLLSRLPVPVDHEAAGARAAIAVWAYPLVGAALGGFAALVGSVAIGLGTPSGIAAALSLAALAILSGAMHEDGLADCADGLGGGRDKEHSLEIMKDSRIGAYGAVALVLALLARWSGIETLAESGALFWPLVAVGAVSRLPMVAAMFLMLPARDDGLSAGVGLPPPSSVLIAMVLALVVVVVGLGWSGFAVLFWAFVASAPLFWLAHRKIGGQTGDVLGGSQQLAEIAALSTIIAAL